MNITEERKGDLEIYIHIPFCVRKCAYCDFLSFPADESVRVAYVDALIRQIRHEGEKYADASVISVFIGGGTPSVLTGRQITRIMESVYAAFAVRNDAEITIECNPGTADERKLGEFTSCGINRLSLGLQSADDRELALLGRIHTWTDFLSVYEAGRRAGLANISIDLMSGLPGQTTAHWLENLKKVVNLQPEHISAYGLIIEEGTPFYARYHEDEERRQAGDKPCELPDEETDREIYHLTGQVLSEYGYRRYEISNYAKAGYESIHNTGYWIRRNYLGFGLGASSLSGHTRWKHTENLQEYLNGNWQRLDEQELTRSEEMEETMFLGLRMMDGVSTGLFQQQFGRDPLELYRDQIRKLRTEGLLELRKDGEDTRICLTEKGIDVSSMVMVQFLL